jgi:hypothetical protein
MISLSTGPLASMQFIDLGGENSSNARVFTILVPGEASLGVLAAIKKSVEKIRSTPRGIDSQYVARKMEKINNVGPVMRKVLTAPAHPIKFAGNYIQQMVAETKQDKAKRVKRELLDAGCTLYGLMKSESRVLPNLLHPHEHIEAVVYGQHRSNSVMLVATDERIIYIDKKPMALFLDEVSYEVVSGIEFEIHTFFAALVLHTPVKNYDIRSANLRCAENFARHIEAERLGKSLAGKDSRHPSQIQSSRIQEQMPKYEYPSELKQNLAGYYMLPMEDEDKEQVAGTGIG